LTPISSYGQWVRLNANTGDHFWGVDFLTDSIGWAVGGWGGIPIRKTTDCGNTWTSQNSGVSAWLQDVSFADSVNGWIAGDGGVILSTTNGGLVWTKDLTSFTNKLSGIKAISSTKALAIGNDGIILIKRNSSSSWSLVPSGVSTTLNRVAFANQNIGCIVGENGLVLLTKDGGETWKKKDVGTTLSLNSVAYASLNDIVIVGANGIFLQSNDSGATWSVKYLSGTPDLRCVSFPTRSKVYVSGHNYIFTSKDSCKTFTRIESGTDWLLGSSFPKEDIGFFVGHGGVIMKTTTGGNNEILVSVDSSILCKKTPFEITYTLLGVFNSPNSLIVQLSDSAGSFSFPIVIGSAATTSTGKIMCKIPDSVSIGTRFRIRLLSTNPIVTGTDNGRDLTVSGLPPPIISGSDLVCYNSLPSTFTVNYQPGYTVHWLKPRIGSIISYKLNAVSIIWNSMGTDSIRVKFEDQLTGCERDTMLRVVITSPEPLITGDARACENQSPKVYRVQKQSGRTYSWSKPKNGIIVGSTTSDSISVQWVNSGSDTLRMEERDNTTNCTKDTSFIVSIAPIPDATIIGSSQVRENEQGITYSVKNESGLRYDWSIVSGDATIAGKTGNSVTLNAGKPGTVILKVKITNQNGCMSESELAITVKSLTNIRESSSAPFTLYPNPAGDHLYVKMDAEITGEIHIELYDVLGNRQFQQTYQTTEIIRIPVQALSQGMYLIKVKTSQDEFMERFVK
jgi:photosystem II stability/assembly factor-like uncharacterized protein